MSEMTNESTASEAAGATEQQAGNVTDQARRSAQTAAEETRGQTGNP
ncbi:hypothetical protein [Streptomyces massasporeus]